MLTLQRRKRSSSTLYVKRPCKMEMNMAFWILRKLIWIDRMEEHDANKVSMATWPITIHYSSSKKHPVQTLHYSLVQFAPPPPKKTKRTCQKSWRNITLTVKQNLPGGNLKTLYLHAPIIQEMEKIDILDNRKVHKK